PRRDAASLRFEEPTTSCSPRFGRVNPCESSWPIRYLRRILISMYGIMCKGAGHAPPSRSCQAEMARLGGYLADNGAAFRRGLPGRCGNGASASLRDFDGPLVLVERAAVAQE